jgi:RNA polymerase sigma factor (sigma-70 family)
MAFKKQLSMAAQAAMDSDTAANQTAINGAVKDAQGSYPVALEELWRTHAKQILRVTQRITNNREDAEDALQDSFLRAYVHLHSFDGRSSLATWLTRIAINSALMILRKRASAPQISLDSQIESSVDLHFLNLIDSTPSAEDQCSQLEQQARVRSAIGSLQPSIREALELHALQEKSVKETADVMGISVSAAKSRIFQAKTALRKSLDRKVSRRSGRTRLLQLSPA